MNYLFRLVIDCLFLYRIYKTKPKMNMKPFTILLSSLLIASVAIKANAQTTIVLQPGPIEGKDAFLHGLASESDNNFGSNAQLPADAWTFGGDAGIIRSIMEFDLSSIPAGAVINGAYLSLYSWDSSGGLGQHSTQSGSNDSWVQRITSSWDELTVTWNTPPSVDVINQVALPASTSSTQDYLDIDVSTLVQDMVDNPSTSFGFMLRLQDETYYRRMNFASSDLHCTLNWLLLIAIPEQQYQKESMKKAILNYFPILTMVNLL